MCGSWRWRSGGKDFSDASSSGISVLGFVPKNGHPQSLYLSVLSLAVEKKPKVLLNRR